MASMNFSAGKQFVKPPQRGIFPLDHDAECKPKMKVRVDVEVAGTIAVCAAHSALMMDCGVKPTATHRQTSGKTVSLKSRHINNFAQHNASQYRNISNVSRKKRISIINAESFPRSTCNVGWITNLWQKRIWMR